MSPAIPPTLQQGFFFPIPSPLIWLRIANAITHCNPILPGDHPRLDVGPLLYAIIGGACLIKLGLWLYCRKLKHLSPAMVALAEDHWNDVLSNLVAIIGEWV